MFNLFRKKKAPDPGNREQGRGLLLFENTSEVIRAEKLLTEQGWKIRVMGPPPEIQKGCDMVVEFSLMEKLHVFRLLEENGIPPLDMVPVSSPLLRPVDLFNITEYPGYLMVRAANMKLVVDTHTLVIVNVSGGGCPDVPYLAARLVGQRLDRAPRPRDIGHTLCGYALELAFGEMERLCLQS
jgi:hypothetical protein